MNIRFSEYRPSLPLRRAVQTFWTGDFNLYSENRFVQSVVPNGCIELIVHLSNNHCRLIRENEWDRTPEFMLIGLQTAPYEVQFNETVPVFGVRFNPDGIYSIFGVPPAQFTASFQDGIDVLGSRFYDYCRQLRDTASIGSKISLTENFLFDQLRKQSRPDDYLSMASANIRRYRGLVSMQQLLHELPVSQRQLQREFKNKFGITAKEYMRLSRLNAIQRYMQSRRINLTELTYETGFADQSHFIKEFRLLTGVNPKKFLSDRDNYIINPGEGGWDDVD